MPFDCGVLTKELSSCYNFGVWWTLFKPSTCIKGVHFRVSLYTLGTCNRFNNQGSFRRVHLNCVVVHTTYVSPKTMSAYPTTYHMSSKCHPCSFCQCVLFGWNVAILMEQVLTYDIILLKTTNVICFVEERIPIIDGSSLTK